MILKNHIAYRFLTDETLAIEMISASNSLRTTQIRTLYEMLNKENQKAYLCTQTVLDNLELLKVKKTEGNYDWTVFNTIKDGKYTYILPDNKVLRMQVSGETMQFCFMHMRGVAPDGRGDLRWELFYLDRSTGEVCSHLLNSHMEEVAKFTYRLLCFMYLTENEEVYLNSGFKYGTKKSGKVINTLPLPVTLVTSKWNITSIRTEAIQVRGHFAIRWTGEGRTNPKLVFIEPFEKKGYIRKAKSQDNESK